MSIRRNKASGVWQIDICSPGIPRVRCSSGTTDKKAAQEYHDRLKAEAWRKAKFGEEPTHTFDEAALQMLRLSEGQRDYDTKVRHVKYWRGALGGGTAVSSLTSGTILQALPTHTSHAHRKATPLTAAAKNRYLATIQRVLSLCVEWGWLNRAPKLRKFVEPDVRVRWEPPAVIVRLIQAMSTDWMREVSLFAVATGMRATEVLSLSWTQVDMGKRHAWITHGRAKNKRARAVPLNSDAMAVLQRRQGTHPTLVFSRRPRPGREPAQISQIDSSILASACKQVGITGFRFHDFRHTWASWHVQAGTPLMVLKELGGWERIEMVQKYAHLAPTHLAHHAENVKITSMSELETKQPPLLAAVNT